MKLEVKNVSFSYDENKNVLKNLNMTVESHERVGILAPSGIGKTTLCKIMAGYLKPDEGEILVDGVDVREYNQKVLRDKIAIALQKSELFSMSISENISWGKTEASKKEIMHAAGVAQADGFICSAPEGYETAVAERGMSLSGGQNSSIR